MVKDAMESAYRRLHTFLLDWYAALSCMWQENTVWGYSASTLPAVELEFGLKFQIKLPDQDFGT